MARPTGINSRLAEVFGVTRQAVHRWRKQGAPFHSAEVLLHWLNNQLHTRCMDYLPPRCPRLLARVKAALSPPTRPSSTSS
jgi:hypothetical protein